MDDRPTVVDPAGRPVEPAGYGLRAFVVRLVMLLFAILQVAIILRIVLLLLAADQANTIVSDILNATAPFVDPFKGMFKVNDLPTTPGSFLDVAAVAALIGWTIAEGIVVGILSLLDR